MNNWFQWESEEREMERKMKLEEKKRGKCMKCSEFFCLSFEFLLFTWDVQYLTGCFLCWISGWVSYRSFHIVIFTHFGRCSRSQAAFVGYFTGEPQTQSSCVPIQLACEGPCSGLKQSVLLWQNRMTDLCLRSPGWKGRRRAVRWQREEPLAGFQHRPKTAHGPFEGDKQKILEHWRTGNNHAVALGFVSSTKAQPFWKCTKALLRKNAVTSAKNKFLQKSESGGHWEWRSTHRLFLNPVKHGLNMLRFVLVFRRHLKGPSADTNRRWWSWLKRGWLVRYETRWIGSWSAAKLLLEAGAFNKEPL